MMDVLKKPTLPFTQIPNELICSDNISAKAKAVYCYLCSRPNDWEFYTKEIEKNFKEGRDFITSAISELQLHGWISKFQVREGGKFSHTVYAIFYTANGKAVNGQTVNGKPATTNTDNTNTDIYTSFKAKYKFIDEVSFGKLVAHLGAKYPDLKNTRITKNINKLIGNEELFSLAVDQMIGLDYNGLFVPSKNKPVNNISDPLLRVAGKIKHESELTQKDLDWLSMAGGFKKNLVRGA